MIIIFSQLFFSSNWARSYQYWAWSYEKKKTIDFFRPLNQFSLILLFLRAANGVQLKVLLQLLLLEEISSCKLFSQK